ncbi:hypothetical protein A2U01_0106518, partial [Trifolium medium]|nr:hypothetical protein [Trifolium medium]
GETKREAFAKRLFPSLGEHSKLPARTRRTGTSLSELSSFAKRAFKLR